MSMTRLLALQRLTDQHDPCLGAWLRSARQRWQEGEPLERAADLIGYGAIEAAKSEVLAVAELLDPKQDQLKNPLAKVIAKALREFESQRWPAAKLLSSPETLSVLDGCCWRALMNSKAIPRSPDRIADVLAQRQQLRQCATVGVWLQRYPKPETTNDSTLRQKHHSRRRR